MATGAKTATQGKRADRHDGDYGYRHPMEVAYHARLSAHMKRAILSQWADKACALDATLMRRDPRTGSIASLDEIGDAVRALDEETARRARAMGAVARSLPQVAPVTVASRIDKALIERSRLDAETIRRPELSRAFVF